MARRRRILLLTALALGVGALAPGGAPAEAMFSAPRFASLEASEAGPDVFAAGGVEKECSQVEFNGAIEDDGHSLALAPLYGECIARSLVGLPTKLVWWGCAYVLHPLGEPGGNGTWKATVDFKCPSHYSVEWNVYESEASYEDGNPMCVTTMPPQRAGGFAEVSEADGTPSALEIRWHLEEVEYEVFGSKLFCGSAPPGSFRRDASYEGSAMIVAKDPEGRRADLKLS